MSQPESAAWRAYFWPGTEVLRNKLELRDAAELATAERRLSRLRLREVGPSFEVSARAYRDLHHHIFQDLYDWAGVYRTVDMRHPAEAAFFCRVEFIANQMDEVFDRLSVMRDQRHTAQSLAAVLAPPLGDLNAIHPFREGNGRVMRAFIARLSQQQGLVFDQTLIDPQRWNEASKVNFQTADATVLRDLLRDAMRSL